MNTRFLIHTILASASLACFSASAADLKEVYERALTNDPLIREAEANRLATRESKPQALAALLPQAYAAWQLMILASPEPMPPSRSARTPFSSVLLSPE